MSVAPEYLHLVHEGPFPTLLYGRNSRDPRKLGRSVSDQLHEGRAMCDKFGFPIVAEFKDTGISASRHGKKKRDEFEDLIDAIESGVARLVVAFEASRYYRDLEIYVRLRNACLESNVLLCYNGMIYDMSKREDRKSTAQDAVQAEDESEGIRDRVLRTVRLNAEAGKPHGKIQFGYLRRYDPDTGDLIGQFPDPERAHYVVEAFAGFDSGKSLYSLTRALRSNPKAARPDGAQWAEKRLKLMLLNPAYVGKRVFQGKVLRDATWEPLLKTADGEPDMDLFRRVGLRISDPSRGAQFDGRAAHLQSGIALCGECGDHAKMRMAKVRGRPCYQCRDYYDTSLMEDVFDAVVEEGVITWLGSPAARAAFVPIADDEVGPEAESRLNALKAQLAEAQELAATLDANGVPGLSMASLAAMERRLQPQIDEAQKTLDQNTSASPLLQRLVLAPDPDAVWNGVPASATESGQPALTLDQKRSVLREVVTVRLYKAKLTGHRAFEPERIKLSFVGEPGFEKKPLGTVEATAVRAQHDARRAEKKAARAAAKQAQVKAD